MKRITALLLAVFAVYASANQYQVDPSGSELKWVGKKVTGQHDGTIAIKSGVVEWDHGTLKGGEFVIDLRSIKVLDIKSPKDNAKLTNHLKSDDFFSADKHPQATFKIASVKATGQNKFEVTGPLTIKGTTHPVTMPLTVQVDGDKVMVEGVALIDRTKWNIRYGSGKFFENLGDKMIYDEFEVAVKLHAKAMQKKAEKHQKAKKS